MNDLTGTLVCEDIHHDMLLISFYKRPVTNSALQYCEHTCAVVVDQQVVKRVVALRDRLATVRSPACSKEENERSTTSEPQEAAAAAAVRGRLGRSAHLLSQRLDGAIISILTIVCIHQVSGSAVIATAAAAPKPLLTFALHQAWHCS